MGLLLRAAGAHGYDGPLRSPRQFGEGFGMGVRRFFLGSTDTVSPGAADAGLFSVGAAGGAADAAGGAAATAAIGVGAMRCFFSQQVQ